MLQAQPRCVHRLNSHTAQILQLVLMGLRAFSKQLGCHVVICLTPSSVPEAQLSQRDCVMFRVIEYFAKSLKSPLK